MVSLPQSALPEPRRLGLPAPDRRNQPIPISRDALSVFALRVAVAVLIGALIAAIAYLLYRSTDVLLQAFAGVLFAVFLSAISGWLSRVTGLRYHWAVTITVIVLLLVAGGLGYLLASRIAGQVAQMSQRIPEMLGQLRDQLSQTQLGKALLDNVPQAAESLPTSEATSQVSGLVSKVGYFLETVIIILFVGIFGAAEPGLYKQGLLLLVPFAYRRRASEAVDAVAFNLRWWLVGQAVLMVAMGVTTTVGLWLIGVPLALTLGIIAGIFEMVPYVGPWLSAAPALLLSLALSPTHVLMTAGLYLGLHLLEGYVLQPLVQRRAIMLMPALILVMQVLFYEVAGLLGLFVAAPLTVSAIIVLKMLYIEDVVGDQNVDVPGEPGNESRAATAQ